MYYIYLLKSRNQKGKVYVGFTKDLKKRVYEHSSGKVFSTKQLLPIELVYYEAYKSKADAKNREKMLKQYGNSLSHLKRRLNQTFGLMEE